MARPQVMLAEAQEAFELQEWPRVRDLCLPLAESEGAFSANAAHLLGGAYRELGDLPAAIRWLYQAALRLNTAEAHFDAAEAFLASGMVDQAHRHYEIALERDPRLTNAHLRLGTIWQQQHQLAEAQRAFERAIQFDPRAALARFHLAEVCLALGDKHRAMGQLHMVLMLRPGFEQAHLLRGGVFQELGDHRQALVEFCQLVNQGYTDADIFRRLAISFQALEDHAQALNAMERAFLQRPDWYDLGIQAARTREAAGQYRKALTLFRKLVRSEEYGLEAREAIARVEARFSLAAPQPNESEAPPVLSLEDLEEPIDSIPFEAPPAMEMGTAPLEPPPNKTSPLGTATRRAPGTAPLQSPKNATAPLDRNSHDLLHGVRHLVDALKPEIKPPALDLGSLKNAFDRFKPKRPQD